MTILDEELAVQTLLTNLAMGESPRWHEGRLWLSDWGAQEIIAVDLDGNCEVLLRVPFSLPFSIDWLPDGSLLVVSGLEGLLMHQDGAGGLVTHADLMRLSSNAWNEIVVDGRIFPEKIALANVAPHHLHAPMPSLVHDRAL